MNNEMNNDNGNEIMIIIKYSRGFAHAAALEGASGSSYHVEIHPKSVPIQQHHQNYLKKAQVYKYLMKNQRQSCKIGVK